MREVSTAFQGYRKGGSIATRSCIATVIDVIAAGRLQEVESSRPWLVAFYLQQERSNLYFYIHVS